MLRPLFFYLMPPRYLLPADLAFFFFFFFVCYAALKYVMRLCKKRSMFMLTVIVRGFDVLIACERLVLDRIVATPCFRYYPARRTPSR